MHASFRLRNSVGSVMQGWIQDFKLEGTHLKKLRGAEGGAKNVGVFRVKNYDFTPPGSAPVMFNVFASYTYATYRMFKPWTVHTKV